MLLSTVLPQILLCLPWVASSVAGGRAILHRLNKPPSLAYINRTSSPSPSSLSTSSIIGRHHHLLKASMPVFNYGGSNFIGRENELGNGTTGEGGGGEGEEEAQRQMMLTAMPDLSDPCFRRYANSIIVNAQPYERRSSISLIHCKLQCLRSQLGIYSCRSFVYDNINQVCDLFAHVGDQAPAKLLRFQTRDYFEPTAAIHCIPPPSPPLSSAQSSASSEHPSIDQFAPAMGVQQQTQVPPAAVPPTLVTGPIVWPTVATSIATSTIPSITIGIQPPSITTTTRRSTATMTSKRAEEEEEEEETGTGLTLLKPAEEEGGGDEDEEEEEEEGGGGDEEEDEEDLQQRLEGARQHSNKNNKKSGGANNNKGCLPGQVPRFLRTKDFELFGQDQHRMAAIKSEQRCVELCAEQGNGTFPMPIQCNSLEYTPAHEECVFSTETAVPVGNGQLRQRPGTDYLERVCVDKKLASDCRNTIYRRFPQMILVGFAETVIDSASLQQCLDSCLNSQQLYGFRCSSGMFYFEEPQLNCILNTEDRQSQPDLFTTETSDLVDYFETGCPESRLAMPKTGPPPTKETTAKEKDEYEDETSEGGGGGVLRKRDFVARTRRERLGWTQWTMCTAQSQWTTLGTQARWRVCAGGRVCGKEERQCILASAIGRKASGNSSGRQSTQKEGSTTDGGGGQWKRGTEKGGGGRGQGKVTTALAAIKLTGKGGGGEKGGDGRRATPGATGAQSGTTTRRLGMPAMNAAGGRAQPRRCRSEECCPLLGSCRLGIRFGLAGNGGANWCKNPCG